MQKASLMTEYNEEQRNAQLALLQAWAYVEGISEAFRFMEKRFGVVNTHVIDFRKNELINAHKRIRKAQNEFEACGGLDVAMKRLTEKEDKE